MSAYKTKNKMQTLYNHNKIRNEKHQQGEDNRKYSARSAWSKNKVHSISIIINVKTVFVRRKMDENSKNEMK